MKRTHLASLLLLVLVVAFPPAAEAHELDTSTARVTLRDGHVVVLAELDALSVFFEASDHATLDTLATASDTELAARLSAARQALENAASLSADGRVVPMVLRTFPTATDVHAAATAMSTDPHGHGPKIKVRFEATQSALNARSLSVSLPASLGPVLFTFDQPAVSLTPPGSVASFPVLTVPAPPTVTPVVERSPVQPWLSIAACFLAAVAIAAQVLPLIARRRDAQSRPKDAPTNPFEPHQLRAEIADAEVSS